MTYLHLPIKIDQKLLNYPSLNMKITTPATFIFFLKHVITQYSSSSSLYDALLHSIHHLQFTFSQLRRPSLSKLTCPSPSISLFISSSSSPQTLIITCNCKLNFSISLSDFPFSLWFWNPCRVGLLLFLLFGN